MGLEVMDKKLSYQTSQASKFILVDTFSSMVSLAVGSCQQ